MLDAKVRRKINRKGSMENFKFKKFLERVRKSKKNCKEGEKPTPVKTHYRQMVVLPEMVKFYIYMCEIFQNI